MGINEARLQAPDDAFESTILQDCLTGVYNAVFLWESPRDAQELLRYAESPEA